MELWVFDRSGIYSGGTINIHNDHEKFLSVMLGYQSMTDTGLGRSGIFESDEVGRFLALNDAPVPGPRKMYLEERPIARSQVPVGDGTTDYRAKVSALARWDHVVKLKR